MVRYILLITIFFTLNLFSQNTEKKPNFLFVLVDDQPYDALGFSKRYPFLKTPNIDKLAEQGVIVKNFFVTQSICSPSRASFLTGTYPHIHGVNQNNKYVDPDWTNYAPFSSHLQNSGYETAHIGKIHMAHKRGKKHIRPGFDYWFSFIGQGEYFNPNVNDNGKEIKLKGYITDILTKKTIDWLINKRDPNKPFSLNLWHKAVHEKHLPAPRHKNLFKNEQLPEPPFGMHKETFDGKPEWQRRKTFGFKWNENDMIPEVLKEENWPIRKYKNMQLLRSLVAVDESLGKVLETLDKIGELENTVIIYSSDNGYFMGEHTFKDKRLAYESSMRVPMIISYPKIISKNSIIEEQCLNIDVAPTILELAGLEKPSYMQGESMLKLISGQKDNSWRKSIFFEYYVDDEWPFAGPDQVAVRTKNYKLVDNFLNDDIDELYDLINDPGEMTNLINDPDYNFIEKELREESKKLQKKYNYNPDRDWWLRTQI
jgi:N-acetylglucosamine-6-sulfatase